MGPVLETMSTWASYVGATQGLFTADMLVSRPMAEDGADASMKRSLLSLPKATNMMLLLGEPGGRELTAGMLLGISRYEQIKNSISHRACAADSGPALR